MMNEGERAARLSGQCPRVAYYTRAGNAAPVPAGPRPRGPRPSSYPRPRPGRPRVRPPTGYPVPDVPKPARPAPVGLTPKGARMAGRILGRISFGALLAEALIGVIAKAIEGELTGAYTVPGYSVEQDCGPSPAGWSGPFWSLGRIAPPNSCQYWIWIDRNEVGQYYPMQTGEPVWELDRLDYQGIGWEWRVRRYWDTSNASQVPEPEPEVGPDYSIDWARSSAGQRAVEFPQIDPLTATPILAPAPIAKPIPVGVLPHRVQSPMRVDQPTWSQPSTSPRPWARPVPVHHIPNVPEIVIEPAPSPGGRPALSFNAAGRHVRRPPGRRERERKLRLTPRKTLLAMVALNLVTEALDALDAVYGTLPQEIRAKVPHRPGWPPTPQEKAAAIAENLDHLDARAIMDAIVRDQLEDAFFGALGRTAAQASQAAHAAGGNVRPQLGPADNPDNPAASGGIVEDAESILQQLVDLANGKDVP